MNKKIGKLIASATTALALATLSNAALASPEAWEAANDAYDSNHYARALEIYQELAAKGDARAAELAGMMLAHGEKLYGDAVRRDPVRAAQLLTQASQAGSPEATRALHRIDTASLKKTSAR